MTHFPDRPSHQVPYEDIPSEEECRGIIVGMKRESFLNQGRGESFSKRGPKRMSWSSSSPSSQGPQGGGDKGQRPRLQIRIPDAKIARQRILLQTTGENTTAYSSFPARVPEEHRCSQQSQVTLLRSQGEQTVPIAKIARKPLPVNSPLLQNEVSQKPKTMSFISSTSRRSSVVADAPKSQYTKPFVATHLSQHIISAYAPRATSKQGSATFKPRFSFSRFWAEPPPRYSGNVAPTQPPVYSCHLCRIPMSSAVGLCKGCQDDFAPPKDTFIASPGSKRSSGRVARTGTEQRQRWRLSNKPLPLLCPGPADQVDRHGKAELAERRPPPGRHDHVGTDGKPGNNTHQSVALSGSPRIIATQHPRQKPNTRGPVALTKGDNILESPMGPLMTSKVTWRPSNQPKEVVALGQKASSRREHSSWWH